MPSVAKKLVVVQNNEPAPEVAPAPATRPEELRLLEALLFAAGEPLDEATLGRRLPNGVNVKATLAQLKDEYATRGVNLVRVGKKWTILGNAYNSANHHPVSHILPSEHVPPPPGEILGSARNVAVSRGVALEGKDP